MKIKTANTIFYCRKWKKTVQFYRDYLKLYVTFEKDWFVEFRINQASRLSIADETRASIKSSQGKGVTLSLEVENIDKVWEYAEASKLSPTAVRQHPWGARIFHLFDPEGHRIELWESVNPGS